MTDYGDTYRFVDTAQGGVNQRNHVKDISDVRLNGVRRECYASYMRATDELVHYIAEHRNPKGDPSIGGFPGKTWTDALRLDFDHEADPSRALAWLRLVCQRLEAMDVNLRAVRFFFSGNKGFHAEIPATLFGGFEPSATLHRDLRRAAIAIMRDIPFDRSVYDKLRLWRLPNSQHGKSGLYKIQLTPNEVLSLDYEAIRSLAAQPRAQESVPDLIPIPDDEWEPVPTLTALWRDAVDGATTADTGDRPPFESSIDVDRDAQTIAAIAASWPKNQDGISRHADYLLPIAGVLCARTSPEHALNLLQSGALEAGDKTFITASRGWQGEIQRIVADSARKVRADDPVSGFPTLAREFPALARVLGVLWPDLRLELSPPRADQDDGAGGAAPKGGFALQNLAQLVNVSDDAGDQLVESILWRHRIHWAFAPAGTGKTLFLLALGMHIAAGRPFCGRAVTPGPVLLIEEDSPFSVIAEYVQMIADIYDFDLAAIPFWVNAEQGFRVADDNGIALVQAAIAACPEPPILVIFDACERIVPSERFTSKELDPLIRAFQWILRQHMTPVMIDHTKKQQPQRKDTIPVDLINQIYGGQSKQAISDVMMHFSGNPLVGIHVSYVKFRGEVPPPLDVTFEPDTGFAIKDQPGRTRTPTERKILAWFANVPTDWYPLTEITKGADIPEKSGARAVAALVKRRWLLKEGAFKDARYQTNPSVPGMFE